MRRWPPWLTVGFFLFHCTLPGIISDSVVRAAEEFQPVEIRVPPGYVVEVVAQPPLVKHPIMGGFDDRGRLYLAETAGENLPRAELEKQLPNFVTRLEDTNGDGRFDKSTRFADKLTFPQGALWHRGEVYVASSGAIWKFRDTDDDGVADVRERLVSQFGYTGNAADVHGCFLGPEGRIYWCEGRHGHEITDAQGTLISKGKAARIFSCLPDGTDIRVHCGGGMDNPVEIDFLPTGEMLGTVNILLNPRGDCLVHWMHGGVYPRFDVPEVVAEFRRTGELLGPVHNFGHVAVSGMLRVRSGDRLLPTVSPDAPPLLVTEFNTHKLQRVDLYRDGATFRAEVSEFLSSTNPDFHPTDVIEAPDGSLLVVDTGGWFRIGCPTSQIAKPNIQGAVYRIRRADQSTAVTDPCGLQIPWNNLSAAELIALGNDSRWMVREQAADLLAQQTDAETRRLLVKSIRAQPQSDQALWGTWVLGRQHTATAELSELLTLGDPRIQLAALHCLGSLRASQATANIIAVLRHVLHESAVDQIAPVDAAVLRSAATSLGQLQQPEALPHLLEIVRKPIDRVLEHAVLYALIELHQPDKLRSFLTSDSTSVQRAALIALNSQPQLMLKQEELAAFLGSPDSRLQQTALEIVNQRPDFRSALPVIVQRVLQAPELPAEKRELLIGILVGQQQDPEVQQLIAAKLGDPQTAPAVQILLLEVFARCRLERYPPEWTGLLQRILTNDRTEPALLSAAITAIRAAPQDVGTQLAPALHQLAKETRWAAEIRMQALATAPSAPLDEPSWELVSQSVAITQPTMLRMTAAEVLGTSPLTDDQLLQTAKLISSAGPLELPALLQAFEKSNSPAIGAELVASLKQSTASATIAPETLRRLAAKYPKEIAARLEPLIAQRELTLQAQSERLTKLEGALKAGNAAQGAAVFELQRISCVACHKVGAQGGDIGPVLTGVGQRRTRRDLLEAILFPSASFVRGYEPVTIAQTDGRVLSGLIVRETADDLWLRVNAQQEVRIRRAEIEELQPSRTSIMPAGLDQSLSHEQLADLLAYLQSLK